MNVTHGFPELILQKPLSLLLARLNESNLNRLVSENKTSNAITLIDGFSKTLSDLPRDLGWTLRSAYDVRGKIDERQLERASEQTAQILALLESMKTGTARANSTRGQFSKT